MNILYFIFLFIFNYILKISLYIPIVALTMLSIYFINELHNIPNITDYISYDIIKDIQNQINDVFNKYSIYAILVLSIYPLLNIIYTILYNGKKNIDSWLISQNIGHFEHIIANVKYEDETIERVKKIFVSNLGKNKSNPKSIKLYRIEDDSFKALSIENFFGEKCIILYDGVISNTTDEELERIINHELSHILYGDSKLNIILYSIYSNIENSINHTLINVTSLYVKSYLFLLKPFLYLYMMYIKTLSILKNIIITILIPIQINIFKSREYMRDKLSATVTSKSRMLSVLTKMLILEKDKCIVERLYDTHPTPSQRIKKINQILNN